MSGPARDVREELVPASWEATADARAEAEAKEEPRLGGCGSGVMVVCNVFQGWSSGLRLLLRSPRPSKAGGSETGAESKAERSRGRGGGYGESRSSPRKRREYNNTREDCKWSVRGGATLSEDTY